MRNLLNLSDDCTSLLSDIESAVLHYYYAYSLLRYIGFFRILSTSSSLPLPFLLLLLVQMNMNLADWLRYNHYIDILSVGYPQLIFPDCAYNDI